jgi:hypothetical protein
MKCVYSPYSDDPKDGGSLKVTVTTLKEVERLLDTMSPRPSDIERLERILDFGALGELTITLGKPGYAYHHNVHTLPVDWSIPYCTLLQRKFGYSGPLPDIDFPDTCGCDQVWVVSRLRLENQLFVCDSYDAARDYRGTWAMFWAKRYSGEQTKQLVGEYDHKPEFIQLPNGDYRRNPAYGGQITYRPAAANEHIVKTLSQWFYDTQASQQVKDVLDADLDSCQRMGLKPYMHSVYANTTLFYRSDDYPHYMPHQEFLKICKAELRSA